MMVKKVRVLGVLLLCLSPAAFANEPLATPVDVSFVSALSPENVAELVGRLNLKPRELYYQSGEMQGGYTLGPDESIQAAIVRMKEEHEKFLAVALAHTREVLRNPDADIVGIPALIRELNRLQAEVKADRFHLSGMRISDARNVRLLLDERIVAQASPVGATRSSARSAVEGSTDSPEGVAPQIAPSTSHESWAPYSGTAKVTQTLSFHTFYFNRVSSFGSTSTYEHEAQVYDRRFADYAGYWSSNMPSAYYDTPVGDSIDNFTVGCARASSLQNYTLYHTYMSLRKGTVNNATVRIKGQLGRRSPSWCISTWCIFSVATTGSMTSFTAPINGISWQY